MDPTNSTQMSFNFPIYMEKPSVQIDESDIENSNEAFSKMRRILEGEMGFIKKIINPDAYISYDDYSDINIEVYTNTEKKFKDKNYSAELKEFQFNLLSECYDLKILSKVFEDIHPSAFVLKSFINAVKSDYFNQPGEKYFNKCKFLIEAGVNVNGLFPTHRLSLKHFPHIEEKETCLDIILRKKYINDLVIELFLSSGGLIHRDLSEKETYRVNKIMHLVNFKIMRTIEFLKSLNVLMPVPGDVKNIICSNMMDGIKLVPEVFQKIMTISSQTVSSRENAAEKLNHVG